MDRERVPVRNVTGNANTFSFTYDSSVHPYGGSLGPGGYQIIVNGDEVTNSTNFEVAGKDPLPRNWIRIDPIPDGFKGVAFNITGTTNLSPDPSFSINARNTMFHSCPQFSGQPPPGGMGTICGGDCFLVNFDGRIHATPVPGYNTWTYTVNTTDWCVKEQYTVSVSKAEWDNVSGDSEEFRIQ